jgi:putative transcriptional regulator
VESLAGKFLVAAPTLVDPNFHRTVVLILAHDQEGALGLVLNRPASVDVGDVTTELAGAVDASEPLFVGGPVQPSTLMIVAEFDDPSAAALIAFEDIGVPATGGDTDELFAQMRRARVFVGHSGWGPGQLDAEMEREDWIVESAEREEVFTDDPEHLWSAVLERKGGRYALVARMPADPRVN